MTSYESVFQHDNPFTIGIEEEYMLCNPETGELINRANEIMENIDSDLIFQLCYLNNLHQYQMSWVMILIVKL